MQKSDGIYIASDSRQITECQSVMTICVPSIFTSSLHVQDKSLNGTECQSVMTICVPSILTFSLNIIIVMKLVL